MNIKKVLIALDYNPTAQKVAEVGFSMAKYMNSNTYQTIRFLEK